MTATVESVPATFPLRSGAARRALALSVVAVLIGCLAALVPVSWSAAGADPGGGIVRTGGAAVALGGPGDLGSVARGVAIVSTASGNGYLVADEGGGVFAYGDATFHGSLGGLVLNKPVVGMAASPSGGGYWLVASDGGVFAFGDAAFHGSGAAATDRGATVSIARTASGHGYWLVDDRGVVYEYGDAPAVAAVADVPVATTVAAAALRPQADGVWALLVPMADSFPALPANSGEGRRIVYSNSMQRVWLVEADGRIFDSYLVSGRRDAPAPGTYSVFSKSEVARSGNLRLDHMVRFTWGRTLAIGFHAIPTRPDGQPVQTLEELGQYRSAGCVRQDPVKAKQLYDWAPVGTKVVVLP